MNMTNRVQIICEETYLETIWCKALLGGLLKELKKHRISFEMFHELNGMMADQMVYVLGQSDEWLSQIVKKCNESGCVPVLLMPGTVNKVQGQYHAVYPDLQNTLEHLKVMLEGAGRSTVALYGANMSVDLDRNRAEVFSELVSRVEDIYPNVGSLEKCFRDFLPKADRYDVILCANGYAAVSLVKKLEKEKPDLLEHVVVIAFEEVLKHSKYNQLISLVELNLEEYGKTALQLSELLGERNEIAAMTVRMKCNLCKIPEKQKEILELQSEKEMAFEDPEIVQMAKVEQLLREADDLDHHIIAMLLENAKYSDIADSCYMTEGNVKYRVKKYMSVSDCHTKKELIELLQEYLQ